MWRKKDKNILFHIIKMISLGKISSLSMILNIVNMNWIIFRNCKWLILSVLKGRPGKIQGLSHKMAGLAPWVSLQVRDQRNDLQWMGREKITGDFWHAN